MNPKPQREGEIEKIFLKYAEAPYDIKNNVFKTLKVRDLIKELSSLIREERKSIRKAFFNHQEVDLGENRSCTKCNRRLCICPEREPDGSINLEKK